MMRHQFCLVKEKSSSSTYDPQSYQYAIFDARKGLISLLHDEAIWHYPPFSWYHRTSTDQFLCQHGFYWYDIPQQSIRVKPWENSDHMYELLQKFVQYIYPKDDQYDSYITQSRDRCANMIDIFMMDANRYEIQHILIQLFAQVQDYHHKDYVFDQLRDEKTFEQYMSQLWDEPLRGEVALDSIIQTQILKIKYEYVRQKIHFYTTRDAVLLYEEYLELENLMKECAEQDQFDIALLIQQYIDPHHM